MLRVGIVGLGMMGKHHMDAIRRIPGTYICAVSDSDEKLAASVGQEQEISGVYSDYREMFQKEKLDSVHICAPNHLHYEICKAAIEAGINIYCEKPLANTQEEAKELYELARQKGVTAAVNFNYRQNAIVREMRERVRQGQCGRMLVIRGNYLQDWMMYDSDFNWRCIPQYGGQSRTVADIGSHWFDTAQFVVGQRITRVFADFINVHPYRKRYTRQVATFEKQEDGDFEEISVPSEDGAHVMVEFENGVKGCVMLSQVAAGHKNGLELHIDGENCGLSWYQESADKLYIRERERGTTEFLCAAGGLTGDANRFTVLPAGHSVGWYDALKNGIHEYYAYLSGKTNEIHFATFQEGWYIVRLVSACVESAAKNQWVTLEREV